MLTNEEVKTVFDVAEQRMVAALQAVADPSTVYRVNYDYELIEKKNIEKEKENGLVFDFLDLREKNQQEYSSGKLITAGNNKSNTQVGLIEIGTYKIETINVVTKRINFNRETLETLSAIVNHEMGHGARLSHPFLETIKDIAQYVIDQNGRQLHDEKGQPVRSDVPDDVIRNNMMNTGEN